MQLLHTQVPSSRLAPSRSPARTKSLSKLHANAAQSDVHTDPWSPDEYVLGIDEAGRGPVIGPMVYAAFAVQVQAIPLLKEYKVTDSKMINPLNREKIFERITSSHNASFHHEIDVIGSDEISRTMSSARKGITLNSLSHDAAIGLIRRFISKKIAIKAVYVDTVGDEKKYQERLQRLFPTIRVVVTTKADSKFLCVGAASIVAKVTRDRKVVEIEKAYGTPLGSGYPSDPNAVRFLKTIVHPFYGFPERDVRLRWATCENLIEKTNEVIKVAFNEPEKKTEKPQKRTKFVRR